MTTPTPDSEHSNQDISPSDPTVSAETLRQRDSGPPAVPAPPPTTHPDDMITGPHPGFGFGASRGPDPERTEVIPPSAIPRRPNPGPANPGRNYGPSPYSAPPQTAPPPPGYAPYPPPPDGHWPPAPPAGWIPHPTRNRLGAHPRLLIGAGAAAVVVAIFLITALWAPGFLRSHTLDINAADKDIAAIVSDPSTGYGLTGVTNVSCNNGQDPTIRQGSSFTCDVTIEGAHRKLTATFTDEDGTYTISRPE